MRVKISKQFKDENVFCCVVGKGINNRTAKSRDIVLRMKKLKEKKKLPNINPFVNFFNVFLLENDVKGIYADLDSVFGDLELDFLKEEKPFLPSGEQEIVFCKKGDEVLYDRHSVTHKLGDSLTGERVEIKSDSSNVFSMFFTKAENSGLLKHSAGEFAKECKSLFGGDWEVFFGEPVEIELVSKEIDDNLDAVEDLKKIAKSRVKGSKGLKKRKEKVDRLVNSNTVLNELNALVAGLLEGYGVSNKVVLKNSPNLKFGHFTSHIAFEISKELGRDVRDVANEIAVKLQGETRVSSVFKEVEVASNGFVNFWLTDNYILEKSKEALKDFSAFSSSNLGENRGILVESPSANPNKAMHVGHLRNIFLAQSLVAIYKKIGFKVYNDNLINDKGLPICKVIWAIKNHAKGSSPEQEGLKGDHFVGKYYVLGEEKFKESKEVEKEIREILSDWEKGDEETKKLWNKIIDWVLEGHKETMGRVNEEMGHLWFESEIYDEGRKIIEENIDDEKVVKLEDGAVIGKLEREYGLPDVVLLKSDGTSLYHTQDIGLTKRKIEEFNPWKAIWVVGNEQIVHFQRLFSLIDLLGLLPIDNLYHLAYGYVFDKDGGKMSSRSGEVLTADELLDIVEKKVKNKEIALGVLKYAFLSSDAFKDMKFDLEKATQFTGKSGPYVMYAYARACNILKNVEDVDEENVDISKLTDLDREILIKCLDYPNIVVDCANNYSPSILAEYLYDLAKLFSQMYETEKVVGADSQEKELRIFIVQIVKKVLADALKLLRITPLERM